MEGNVPPPEQIESLEQWLETNGLRSAQNNPDQEERWEQAVDRARVQAAEAYQASIHQQIFASHGEDSEQEQRNAQLQAWQGKLLDMDCQDGVRLTSELVPLASSCGFVFALAASWKHFNNDGLHSNNLLLNLPEYNSHTVQLLLDVVKGDIQIKDISDSDRLVQLCQLAHYVRGEAIVEELENIFLQSIDTANCLALTQLADQLNMKRLFEASLQRMMQSVQNLEEKEFWEDLTPELRDRINAIQAAIQTSIHDQRSSLYFGSLTEYLAIFAERVSYYKERLEEAEEQQASRAKSDGWYDAQRKIDRQRIRLRTLQVAFREQKQLFAGKQRREH